MNAHGTNIPDLQHSRANTDLLGNCPLIRFAHPRYHLRSTTGSGSKNDTHGGPDGGSSVGWGEMGRGGGIGGGATEPY